MPDKKQYRVWILRNGNRLEGSTMYVLDTSAEQAEQQVQADIVSFEAEEIMEDDPDYENI